METKIDNLKGKIKILLLEIAVDDKYSLQEIKEKSLQGESIESGEIFRNFSDEKNTQSYLDIQEKIEEKFPGVIPELYQSILKNAWEFIRGFDDLNTDSLDAQQLDERIEVYSTFQKDYPEQIYKPNILSPEPVKYGDKEVQSEPPTIIE